ncbi:MAG: hypothetical protein QMB16_07755 [Paracoccaceae bacterium]|jgi:hypothetical protein
MIKIPDQKSNTPPVKASEGSSEPNVLVDSITVKSVIIAVRQWMNEGKVQ